MSATPMSAPRYERWFVPALIAVCVLLYAKGLRYDFSPADERWLINGEEERLGHWHHLIEAFRFRIQNVYYRPLLIWSFVVNYKIGALGPFVYHVTNVALHACATTLLYRLLTTLGAARLPSFLIALLFAVNPVHLHAVAWIPGRNDSMLCVFCLASLLGLSDYLRTGQVVPLVIHFIAFAAALFTKESAFPVIAVYAAYSLLVKPSRIRFVIPALGWAGLLFLWNYARTTIFTSEPPFPTFTFAALPKFLYSLASVTGKTIFPYHQSVAPVAEPVTAFAGIAVFSVIVLTMRKAIRNNRLLAITGLVMYFSMVTLPVWFGSRMPLGELYEHRLYTPLAGLAMYASALAPAHVTVRLRYGVAALACIYFAVAFYRMSVYGSVDRYLAQALLDTPRNYMLHIQQAELNVNEGNLNEADRHLAIAVSIQPKKPYLRQMRGDLYNMMGRRDLAEKEYRLALDLYGTPDAGIVGPGMKRMTLADILRERMTILNRLIDENPRSGILYVNRAKAYLDMRKGTEALADLKKACELEPSNPDFRRYYNELARSYPGR